MPFVLDTDTFIEAKDDFYGFDFCPAYWDWLLRENSAGEIFSIDRVLQELGSGNDDLAVWASRRGAGFFLPMDTQTAAAFKRVSNYVQNLPASFPAHKKNVFLGGADPILIAHALAHGYTVVTREIFAPGATSKIKVPNVCQHFDVPVMRPCDMMRALQASFVLAPKSA